MSVPGLRPHGVFQPDVTVACVIEREGRFLLVQERVRGRLVLNQPAGHLEAGESLQQAALRETLEETRWQVELTGLVGVYQWQAPDGVHFLRFAFAAQALLEHAQRRLDHGIEDVLWLSRQQIEDRHAELRSPLVLRAIEDAGTAAPVSADVLRQVR